MKYQKEIEYIEKQIKKTEISIDNTNKKPNANLTEINNLNTKLSILQNIKNVLVSNN